MTSDRARLSRAIYGDGPPGQTATGGPAPRVAGEHPAITLAIASHNRRDSLRSVLIALARQDYPRERFEVVAVLDGCTDGSAEMARSVEVPYRLRTIEQPQSGLAAARNRGLAEAGHPLVLFLDDDLEPVAGFIEAHAAQHRDQGESCVVVGHSPPADVGKGFWAEEIRRWWEDRFRRLEDPAHRWSFIDFADGNFSAPAKLLQAHRGWDEGFTRRQDWELAARLLDAGVRFSYRADATAWHRFDASLSVAVANRHAEGASDVAFAARHPRWRSQLQLAALSALHERSPSRRRLIRGAYRRPWLARALARHGMGSLIVLERLNRRAAWSAMLGRLMMLQYLLGVIEAEPSLEQFSALAHAIERDTGERVTIDLDRTGPVALPQRPGPVEVSVVRDGREVACVPGTLPMQQWDWDNLIDRIIDAGALER